MTWFSDKERGFAMSIRQTAIPLGGAIGALLLPWVAKYYGFAFVFGIIAISCFLGTAIVWLWLFENKLDIKEKGNTEYKQKSPFLVKEIWRLILASSLLAMPQIAILTFAMIFLHEYKHIEIIKVSIILVFIQIGGAILRILAGKFTDKLRNRRTTIKMIGLFSGVFTIAIGLFANNYPIAIIFCIILSGFLSNAWHGVAYTEIAVIAGVQRAGTALGMIGTAIFISGFITPLIISVIITHFSWNITWCLIGLCSLLSIPFIPRQKSKKMPHVSYSP
ncbi:MFS transporter [Fluviispira vulneris]|uniref:MFS transporter n=1 Tax=Fluviispira vulneris TaxID=2763012 RepID=UPI002571131B|nr:MFS transporter [Fluviispira vulneris]